MDVQVFGCLECWVTGLLQTVICVLGLLGNTTTLFILNANREMRKQSINVYLTVLALYDNGVLFNAILMLCVPNIYKLLSTFQSSDLKLQTMATNQSSKNSTSMALEAMQVSFSDTSSDFIDSSSAFNQSFDWMSLEDVLRNESWPYLTNTTNDALGNEYMSDGPSQIPQDPSPLHLYIQIVYPLALISQTGSIWTTCLITAERYFAVCHPLRALTLSTRSRAIWALSLLSLGAFIYNIPRFWEVELHEINGVTAVGPSHLRQNVLYYYLYYICLNLALIHVIPLTLLSVLNTKIYVAVRRATRDRNDMTNHEQSELNIASMLVLLVAIFIGCNAPAFVVNCLEILDSPYFPVMITFSNLLVCFNSSVNFLIYCIFGKKFRERLKAVFACRIQRPRLKSTCTRNQFGASFVGETYV